MAQLVICPTVSFGALLAGHTSKLTGHRTLCPGQRTEDRGPDGSISTINSNGSWPRAATDSLKYLIRSKFFENIRYLFTNYLYYDYRLHKQLDQLIMKTNGTGYGLQILQDDIGLKHVDSSLDTDLEFIHCPAFIIISCQNFNNPYNVFTSITQLAFFCTACLAVFVLFYLFTFFCLLIIKMLIKYIYLWAHLVRLQRQLRGHIRPLKGLYINMNM